VKKYLIILIVLFAVLYFVFPSASHAQELELAPVEEFSALSSGSYSSGSIEYGSIAGAGSMISISFGTGCDYESYINTYVFGVPHDMDDYLEMSNPPSLTQIGVSLAPTGPAQYTADLSLPAYNPVIYQSIIVVAECTDFAGSLHRTAFIYNTTPDATLGDVTVGLAILIVLASITLVAFIFNRIKKPWR